MPTIQWCFEIRWVDKHTKERSHGEIDFLLNSYTEKEAQYQNKVSMKYSAHNLKNTYTNPVH